MGKRPFVICKWSLEWVLKIKGNMGLRQVEQGIFFISSKVFRIFDDFSKFRSVPSVDSNLKNHQILMPKIFDKK